MHLNEFFDFITYEKRVSNHTLIAYRNDLENFQGFISAEYESKLEEVNYQMIRTWLVQLMDQGITPKSINRKISSLKSFYKFLLKKEVITQNPTARIVAPKIPKRLPAFIEENKIEKLFDSIEFGNDFSGKRDRLILELFYGCGIRLSELIGLKKSDITSNTIKVLGKGNKERIIPISESINSQIKFYLKEKNNLPDSNVNQDVLLVLNNGKKMYPKFVYNKVKSYLGKVTSMDKKSPHILRHTFATHLLNNGAEINAIKELLGHSSLAATQIYTHNSIEKLKNIYTKSHPLAG